MTLSDQDIEKIAQGVAHRLETEYGLEPEAFAEMNRVVGVIRDIGDDNYNRGIETIRDMGRSFRSIRKLSGYIGQVITYLIVAALFGGMLYFFRAGVKACFKALK